MQFAYDNLGQLIIEYQEHGGAVNTSTSLKVEYTYANGSSNTIRMTRMTYPDGRELNYSYGSSGSTDDALSRVASLIDDDGTTHLVDYSYLGAGSFTGTDCAAIDVKNTLVGTAGGDDPDTGDIYRGLDRFGRVKDCYWYDYGSSPDVLRIKHGHDRAGNRLYREEAETSDLDQLYGYDDVNRLTLSEEGTLSGTKDSVSSLNFKQQWSLDATGNWSSFKEDDDGDSTWDLEQTRTSNAVNEITNVTETTGPSWLTPAYNRAGNMTNIPQPSDPTQSYTATYDAWNRLVKLEDGASTVAEYVFDGAKRLVVRKKYVFGSLNQTRHFYHTAQWQTIEERLESGGQIASTADRQFTWGLRYIDDLVCRTVNSTHDYAYQDANWNVVHSSSGLSRVGYEAYGQIRSTCPAASGDLDAWQHYFAGYRRDEDTGLYLVRHRVHQPELGCWVQRDPIGYGAEDVNLYRYVRNGPLAAVDPLGWDTLAPVAGPGGPSVVWPKPPIVRPGGPGGYYTWGASWYSLKADEEYVYRHCAHKCLCNLGSVKLIRDLEHHICDIVDHMVFDPGEADDGVWPHLQIFDPDGTPRRATRQHSALRHCIYSGLAARRLGSCACAACIVDSRDMYQYLFGKQKDVSTQQAIFNDREGRYCARCRGGYADQMPQLRVVGGGHYFETRYSFASEESIVACCREKLLRRQLATDTTMNDPSLFPILPPKPAPGTPPATTPPTFPWPGAGMK